jgi:Flp pilus assembly protein TadG
MTGIPNSRLRHSSGQAMVEFVIVLPLVLMLLFGIIQFGTIFNHVETITDAARVGARKAAVSRLEADPVALAEAAARGSAAGLDQSQMEVEVQDDTWTAGSNVTVTVTYPYSIDILGVPVKTGMLSSSTTERVE